MKKTLFILLTALICMSALASCGGSGNGGNEVATVTGATVEDGVLKLLLSDNSTIRVGVLPMNSERIAFTSAEIKDDGLYVSFNDGYMKRFAEFNSYKDKITGASITAEGALLIQTTDGEVDLGQVFYPTVPAAPLTPSGASGYAASRDTTGRNTATVEMDVKGYGKVTILLDATTAPVTVKNFVKLAKSGFYDGLTFHRIIENFMIQGGDPLGTGGGGSGTNIYGEFSSNGYQGNDILHKPGTISMARAEDKNSASSQFFICTADYTYGDGNYAAFGYVINGMNIVYEISELGAVYGDSNGTVRDHDKQIVINSIEVIEDLDAEDESGEGSGEGSGDNSGENSGEGSGEGSGDNSGENSGEGSGEGSGDNSGEGSGENSGEGSGENSGGYEDDSDDGGWSRPD